MSTIIDKPEESGGGGGYSEGDDPSFGTITATSKVSLPDGTNSAPSLTNTGDTNTGIYFPGADNVGITAGGTKIVDVSSTGINVTGTITGDTSLTLDSTTLTTAELGVLNGVTAGDAAGGKALVLDSNKDLNDTTAVIRALRIDTFGVGTAPSMVSGEILATNDITAFYSSDKRLKDNITPITEPLSKLSQLGGYTFDWIPKEGIHSHEGRDVGVIAQEVEEVLPEVTTTRHNGYKAVKYEKIVPLLIECIKAQQSQIDELKESLSELKKIK